MVLALRVVEIGGDGNHHADQIAAQGFFGTQFEGFEDFRRHFDRRFHPLPRMQFDKALIVAETVRQVMRILMQIGKSPPDKAFGGADGVQRVGFLGGQGGFADFNAAVFQIADDGRQGNAPVGIGQAGGTAAADGGDQAVGRTQIDACRQTVLGAGRRTYPVLKSAKEP